MNIANLPHEDIVSELKTTDDVEETKDLVAGLLDALHREKDVRSVKDAARLRHDCMTSKLKDFAEAGMLHSLRGLVEAKVADIQTAIQNGKEHSLVLTHKALHGVLEVPNDVVTLFRDNHLPLRGDMEMRTGMPLVKCQFVWELKSKENEHWVSRHYEFTFDLSSPYRRREDAYHNRMMTERHMPMSMRGIEYLQKDLDKERDERIAARVSSRVTAMVMEEIAKEKA